MRGRALGERQGVEEARAVAQGGPAVHQHLGVGARHADDVDGVPAAHGVEVQVIRPEDGAPLAVGVGAPRAHHVAGLVVGVGEVARGVPCAVGAAAARGGQASVGVVADLGAGAVAVHDGGDAVGAGTAEEGEG